MDLKEITSFVKCMNFAAVKHRAQRRSDEEKTPYINHPIGVCAILTEAGITDFNTLMAALLHDTVEDTDTSFEEIEMYFGLEIRSIVEEVTDDKSLPKSERKRLQIIHANQISEQAKLVKLADKIYNLRDLQKSTPVNWTKERVDDYFVWSKKVTDNMKGLSIELDGQLEKLYRNHDSNHGSI